MGSPRVLYLIDTYFVGGAGKVLLQFLKNVPSADFSYFVGTFRYPNAPSTEFIDTARGFGFPLRLFRQNFLFDPAPLWQVWKVVRQERVNIIESHGYKGHLIAWMLRHFLGLKWIGVTHGWTDENARIRLYGKLDRWLLQKADEVITVSPPLYQTMSEIRGKKPTSLVLNGIDPEMIPGTVGGAVLRKRLAIDDETLLVGVFGRLSPEKGQELAVEAFLPLLGENDGIKLIFVGDGQERHKLQQQVTDAGLEDVVIFAGQQKDVGDYFEAIDLLLLPSLSEGLPFVVLEAMSFAKPVLATDVGALSEVIEHGVNGWLVPAGDVSALSKAAEEILANSFLLEETGRKAKEMLYPRFGVNRQCTEIMDVYTRLLDNQDNPAATS